MGAVTPHVLDKHVGAIGFKRDTICIPSAEEQTRTYSLTISIIDNRVLDNDIRGSVCVPSISVLGNILASACPRYIDIVKDDVGGVGHKMIVLWRVSEDQVGEN